MSRARDGQTRTIHISTAITKHNLGSSCPAHPVESSGLDRHHLTRTHRDSSRLQLNRQHGETFGSSHPAQLEGDLGVAVGAITAQRPSPEPRTRAASKNRRPRPMALVRRARTRSVRSGPRRAQGSASVAGGGPQIPRMSHPPPGRTTRTPTSWTHAWRSGCRGPYSQDRAAGIRRAADRRTTHSARSLRVGLANRGPLRTGPSPPSQP